MLAMNFRGPRRVRVGSVIATHAIAYLLPGREEDVDSEEEN